MLNFFGWHLARAITLFFLFFQFNPHMAGTMIEQHLPVPLLADYNERREKIAKKDNVPVNSLDPFQGLDKKTEMPQGTWELNKPLLLVASRRAKDFAMYEEQLVKTLTAEQIRKRATNSPQGAEKYLEHLNIGLELAKEEGRETDVKLFEEAIRKVESGEDELINTDESAISDDNDDIDIEEED